MKISHKKIILFSIWVGLIVGFLAYLTTPPTKAEPTNDYWRGTVDEKIKTGEDRDKVLFAKMDALDKKITEFCDKADVRLANAEKEVIKRSGVWGGSASGIIWIILSLGKVLYKKKTRGDDQRD